MKRIVCHTERTTEHVTLSDHTNVSLCNVDGRVSKKQVNQTVIQLALITKTNIGRNTLVNHYR